MGRPKFASMFETFLPVAEPIKGDLAPEGDPTYLAARGVEPEAPAILRQIRDDVLPLVRRLEAYGLEWYSFLIHSYQSGVPTTPEDPKAYIHLRLSFKLYQDGMTDPAHLKPHLPERWLMTRKIELSREIAGVYPATLVDDDIERAWWMIGEQSVWLLSLIEQHKADADGLALTRHVRQFLHYFANATQMKVA